MKIEEINCIKEKVRLFIRRDNEQLFFYNSACNVWAPHSGTRAATALQILLSKENIQLSATEAKAVVNELLYDYTFKIPLPEPPKDYINCKNGVLSLKGPRLLPDSEVNEIEAYFRVQLDFEYQKKLTEENCPIFMNFLRHALDIKDDKPDSILTNASVTRLLEMLGYIVSNEYKAKKLMVILGPANSGKSQILELVRRVVGYTNTVALTLDELSGQSGGRFRTELLTQAHALINDELPTNGLKHLSELKKIIAGEAITIEAKGAKPKTIRNTTKLLFAGNQLPDLAEPDCGNAFASRLCVVAFKEAAPENRKNVNLVEEFYGERDAIFTLAVNAFAKMKRNALEFTEDQEADAIVQAYMDENSSVVTFVKDSTVVQPGKGIRTMELYHRYQRYCQQEGLTPAKDLKAFRQQLLSIPVIKGIRKGRLTKDNPPCSVVWGIKLVS